MKFPELKLSIMYTGLIVCLAIAIALVQFLKDRNQETEDKARQAEIDSINKVSQFKSDEIIVLQREGLKYHEDAKKKSNELIEKQSKAILLQLKLDEYVTGGSNKPQIKIQPLPMMPFPGQENLISSSQDKYKQVSITLSNEGRVPLRNVKIIASGAMGIDLSKGPTNTNNAGPSIVELGPISLAPGQTVNVYNPKYPRYINFLKFHFNVTWENGYYTMTSEYPSNDVGEPFVGKHKLMVGNIAILDIKKFFQAPKRTKDFKL